MEIKTVYSPGAGEALAFAANQLSGYLSRMLASETGALTVGLEVRPDPAPGRPDWFWVELGPEGGTVAGNSGRAALLGVYDCLRRLGCRFLAPVKGCETVPSLTRKELALRYEHRASFYHRGVCIEGADSRENVLDFIDWLPKAGYNSFFLQFKSPYIFYARWYEHRNNPLREAEPFTPADAQDWMEEAERELRRRGLLLHKVGHGWTGEVLGREARSWDAASEELSADKRPLAAQVGGYGGCGGGWPPTPTCASTAGRPRTPSPPWWRTMPGNTPVWTTSTSGWRTSTTMCASAGAAKRPPHPTNMWSCSMKSTAG